MQEKVKDHFETPSSSADIELYGDPGIASYDQKVPKFLIFNYLFWPIWGLFTLYYFWNGSAGWMDRGYWHQLQIAANTTFPIENQNNRSEIPINDKEHEEKEHSH